MNKPTDTSMLRPEARPFSWDSLHESQRQAFKLIIRAMVQAVERLDKRPEKTNEPRGYGSIFIDPNRVNHTLLLSGERGTGKTSALLTVQCALGDRNWGKKMDEALKDDLNVLREAPLIWLETLDMEPLPGPTNLLASILARVEDAIDRVETDLSESPRGLLSPYMGAEKALMDLRQLSTAVALSWNGNIHQRGANLDPDAYASEVMRVERSRLSLNRNLSKALDQLAEKVFGGKRGERALFVLPVDDFDLNPIRCLDLLQLLRAIIVPRLLMITLGDLAVAEKVVRLQTAGNLAELGQTLLAQEVFENADLPTFVNRVAVNSLRKLLPPGQRIHLRHLSVGESLKFHPADGYPTLEKILEQCPFKLSLAEKSFGERSSDRIECLKGFLFVGPLSPAFPGYAASDKGGKNGEVVPVYSASALFAGPAREIADLWFALSKLSESQSDSSLDVARFAAQGLREAVTNDPDLGSEECRHILESVTIRPDRTVEFDSTSAITDCKTAWFSTYPRKDMLSSINLRRHKGWQIHWQPEDRSDSEPEKKAGMLKNLRSWQRLSDGTRGYLELLHDTLVLTSPESIVSRSPIPTIYGGKYVSVTWELSINKPIEVSWLGPLLQSYWHLDRFLFAWNHILDACSRQFPESQQPAEKLEEFLGLNWIAAANAVLTGEQSIWIELSDIEGGSVNIHRLIEQTASITDHPEHSRQHWLYDNWLRCIAVILAPESGLALWVANKFCNNTKLENFWSNEMNASKIRRLRAWLVEETWAWEGLNPVLALVNPHAFMERVLDELKKMEQKLKAGKEQAREDIFELINITVGKVHDNIATKKDFTFLLDELSRLGFDDHFLLSNLTAAEKYLEIAKRNAKHPINILANGRLCARRDDRYRSYR